MGRDLADEPVSNDDLSPAGEAGSSLSTPTKPVPPPPPPPTRGSHGEPAQSLLRRVPIPPPPPGLSHPTSPTFDDHDGVPPSAVDTVDQRRGLSARLRGIIGFLAVCVLLVSGFVLGQLWSDDSTGSFLSVVDGDPRDMSRERDDSVASASEAGTDTVDSFLEMEPDPVVSASSLEPVAEVAEALSRSIVVIISREGQGSGVVWDAENGYIVTNNHVVELSTNVDVEFPDGQKVVGTVIGGDPSRDVAVVRVDADEVNSLVQAVFAPTSEVRVGQLAVAIGGPFGLEQSVTAGVVSAINRVLLEGGSDPDNPSPVEMIQTDAPINPGNSGGALADRRGRVIGINTQIRTTGTTVGNVGVGFAIPSDTIVLIARRIVSGESLDLGFLGIQGETPTDGSHGALVTSVVDGSPADSSGLKAGDLIDAVNGKHITSMVDLAAEIKLFRPGETVEIELIRDGIRLTVQAILAAG